MGKQSPVQDEDADIFTVEKIMEMKLACQEKIQAFLSRLSSAKWLLGLFERSWVSYLFHLESHRSWRRNHRHRFSEFCPKFHWKRRLILCPWLEILEDHQRRAFRQHQWFRRCWSEWRSLRRRRVCIALDLRWWSWCSDHVPMKGIQRGLF